MFCNNEWWLVFFYEFFESCVFDVEVGVDFVSFSVFWRSVGEDYVFWFVIFF